MTDKEADRYNAMLKSHNQQLRDEGARAERARIRKELLAEIGPPMDLSTPGRFEKHWREGWNEGRAHALRSLNRIIPEP